jgi:hypothetical protein
MENQDQNLTLADAILLGSQVVKPKAGVQMETGNQAGCALGMANTAKGVTYRNLTPEESATYSLRGGMPRAEGTADVWGQWVLQEVARPCECREKTPAEINREPSIYFMNAAFSVFNGSSYVFKLLSPQMKIQDVITHLFDVHVMAVQETSPSDPPAKTRWTIEQLADWVRSVEGPAREAEKEKQRKIREEQEARWKREGNYPITYTGSMYSMLLGGYGLTRNIFNLDGSITLEAIPANETSVMHKQGFEWSPACNAWVKVPKHGAYAEPSEPTVASNAEPGDASWKTSEITLENLIKMVESMIK